MDDNIYTAKQISEDANSMTKEKFKEKYLIDFDNCFEAGEDYNKLMKVANELGIEDHQLPQNEPNDEDKNLFNKALNTLKIRR